MDNKRSLASTIFTSKSVTIPNILSCFRILLIPLFGWLYASAYDYSMAGYVLILSGITDIADGFIARRFHMVSDLGKILDPIADKLTQAAVLVCLGAKFPFMLLPLSLLVIKEIVLSISGAFVVVKHGIVYGAYWHGKLATVLLYIMLLLHIFWPGIPAAMSTASILSCTVMMLLSFMLYGLQNIKVLRRK